jgi:hypothetical protein
MILGVSATTVASAIQLLSPQYLIELTMDTFHRAMIGSIQLANIR